MKNAFIDIGNFVLRDNISLSNISLLENYISAFNFNENNLAPYLVPPADKPYGRNLIYQNEAIEIIIMNWAKNAFCDIHNHGHSFGLVKIIKGVLKNELFDAQFSLQEEAIYREGDHILVPKGIYHRMGNMYALQNAISLHFYMPPIHNMHVIDTENKIICEVSDDCGAWLSEPNKIKAKLNFE
jgi:cysteine dioxygenase